MEVLKKLQKISKRTPKRSKTQTASESGHAHYNFGSFRLDQVERMLLRNGVKVPLTLTPKVFDILLTLVQNAGRLVTKEDLLQRVWPDTFVEEANLSVNVATIRKALAEGDGESEYIETLPKRGYRFVAKVIIERDQGTASMRKVNVSSHKQHRDKVHSVAILPFYNESSDPNAEYLSVLSTACRTSRICELSAGPRYFVIRGKNLMAGLLGKNCV
jgi:DNA-binding winged helix-turn-helix (wHTH) protein